VSIKQHYHTTISAQGYHHDPEQAAAIDHFQRLYDELLTPVTAPGLFSRLLIRPAATPLGLYLCGGPGRGKTFLMDLFYHHLPIQQKQRLHFHHFMQNIHTELAQITHQSEPLAVIAQRIAANTRVLCLDEFYVADIGDAMLLAGLLEALFAHHVILVTTSNSRPDDLYRNGLQRERFLPAIALIKAQTRLVKMHRGEDFRLQSSGEPSLRHYQLCTKDEAPALMAQQFQQLTGKPFEKKAVALRINGREITLVAEDQDLIWFDFDALCETPRAAGDYLEIATRYQRVMLTHIPRLNEALDNPAIRFIHLIDALYDRRVELITTAAAPPQDLYCGIHHTNSFKRTASRLCEMGRHDDTVN